MIDSAFIVTICFSVVIGSILFMGAPIWASFFKNVNLVGLFRIASIVYCVRSLNSLYRCLNLRSFRYGSLARVDVISLVVSGFVSIWMAKRGVGAESIFWGQLCGALITIFFLSYISKFIPSFFGSIREIKKLWSFGMWVYLGRLMNSASSNFDKILMGRLFPTGETDAYYVGQNIATMFANSLTGVLDQVSFPIYSRMQNDLKRVHRAYFRSLLASALLAVPVCALVLLLNKDVIEVLFGEKWHDSAKIVAILSPAGIIQSLGGGVFSALVMALGRPKFNSLIAFLKLALLPPFVWWGSHWGLSGVAWGIVMYSVIGRSINQLILQLYFQVSFWRYLEVCAKALAPLLVSMLLPIFLKFQLSDIQAIPRILVVILSFFVIFIPMTRILLPGEYQEIKAHLLSKLKTRLKKPRGEGE